MPEDRLGGRFPAIGHERQELFTAEDAEVAEENTVIVILSEAKDLLHLHNILRFAQNDRLVEVLRALCALCRKNAVYRTPTTPRTDSINLAES